MTMTLLNSITVFVLAVFIGIEIISKVPTMLHTPVSYTHLTLPTKA